MTLIKINKQKAWAPLTWFLFHCLAENIKEISFNKQIESVIYHIKNICRCLPCPYCASDATKVLDTFDYSILKTKFDLKLFLFNFHNIINRKLKKKQYEYEILESYKKINFLKCIDDWKKYFKTFEKNYKDFITPKLRIDCVSKFLDYLNKNRDDFNIK